MKINDQNQRFSFGDLKKAELTSLKNKIFLRLSKLITIIILYWKSGLKMRKRTINNRNDVIKFGRSRFSCGK